MALFKESQTFEASEEGFPSAFLHKLHEFLAGPARHSRASVSIRLTNSHNHLDKGSKKVPLAFIWLFIFPFTF